MGHSEDFSNLIVVTNVLISIFRSDVKKFDWYRWRRCASLWLNI